ncbi:aspartic protein nepenthesin-1 [Dorcoceras hygrometricum]|uniref:Aspartic protein nepenthesin-1 n=1 Tax=Dorcoceras hygrometricum TaxID=472368 RepID=A0A2Z7BXG5_9LAMI|nr:aspartic protein nepenthesin-1 [Dorcoceras hygrometricum]
MKWSAKLKRRRIENQQMKQSAREEATSYGDSADGLEVDDVIGDVIQSQESADSAGRLCVVNSADEATVSSRNAKISSRKMNSRRKQQQHPVESLFESAVANQSVASSTHPVASFGSGSRKEEAGEA